MIVDFPLQADAFRGRGRAAFPAGVAAFRFKSINAPKLAFNRTEKKRGKLFNHIYCFSFIFIANAAFVKLAGFDLDFSLGQ
ncbi:MAG: hypothetical protein ACE3JP_12225 [Ectobacillus sp.]